MIDHKSSGKPQGLPLVAEGKEESTQYGTRLLGSTMAYLSDSEDG